MRGTEKWLEHTQDLRALCPGNGVLIQNQYGAGKAAKRWDNPGFILEDLSYNKYCVKIDGSGRVTDHNIHFLKKFTPLTPRKPGLTPYTMNPTPETPTPKTVNPTQEPLVDAGPNPTISPTPQFEDVTDSPALPSDRTLMQPLELEVESPVRKSTRVRKPAMRFDSA